MDKPTLAIQFFSKAVSECENTQNANKETISKEKHSKKDAKANQQSNNNQSGANSNGIANKNFYEIYRQNAASKLPMIIYNIALSFYKKENYEEAIKHFLQIGSSQSSNFWYWYRLGVCYYKVYIKKITEKYQSCKNDLYTPSDDFPHPLPNLSCPYDKKERTNSSSSGHGLPPGG